MRQWNFPRRQVTLAQTLVSLLLVILSLVMSFTPILTVNLKDNDLVSAVKDSLASMSEEYSVDNEFEIPDEVDITMPKLLRADMILVQALKISFVAGTSGTDALSIAERQKRDREEAKLGEMLNSEEGKEALVALLAAMSQVADLYETDEDKTEEDKSVLGEMILLDVRIVVLLLLMLFITIMPVIVGIAALKCLIRVLKNLKSPQNACSTVSGITIRYLLYAVLFAIALILFEGMEFGFGLSAILAFSLINFVVNVVVTRLRSYESGDFEFVNITQGTALLGGIGAILFLVGVLKVNAVNGFFGAFGSYFEELTTETEAINLQIKLYNSLADSHVASFEAGKIYIVDIVILSLFALMALTIAVSAVSVFASHISLATPNSKRRESGYISLGVGAIITSVLPFVLGMLKSAKHYELEDIDNGRAIINETIDGAIYSPSSGTKGAAIAMLIGGILILAAGIAASVLKKKYCPKMTETRATLILHGRAPEVEVAQAAAEQTAEAQTEAPEQNESVR